MPTPASARRTSACRAATAAWSAAPSGLGAAVTTALGGNEGREEAAAAPPPPPPAVAAAGDAASPYARPAASRAASVGQCAGMVEAVDEDTAARLATEAEAEAASPA